MNSLYICYQSVLEPLTQTQVIAYLEGLAQGGHEIVLVTFEPRRLRENEASETRKFLASKGITWYSLRYHKTPSVPATAWDVAVGIVVGLALVWHHRIRLIHARSHVAGLMALVLKVLTRSRLLFDMRGFLAEEYVEAGTWRGGSMIFKVVKAAERLLVRYSDAVIVLTRRAAELVRTWYPNESSGKLIEVIPCCIDLRSKPSDGAAHCDEAKRGPRTVVYVGKLGGSYLSEEMLRFFEACRAAMPDLQWQIWTQSTPDRTDGIRLLVHERGLERAVSIGMRPPGLLDPELTRADFAVSLVRPGLSKAGMSPTKFGDYLAAGLPIVSTAGIGDMDDLLAGRYSSDGGPVGVVVRDFSETSFREVIPELARLLADPTVRRRCRAVAEQELDLIRVGWDRYRKVYSLLAGEGQ